MQEHRNPDQLLQLAQEEERQQTRGKLKIFFGAAPGVGKTYTMLQDALQKREKGLDVVVGIVESHGRKEVEDLLQSLEILPRLTIEYKNKELYEFDLPGALSRSPALMLVDEMAHTNAPNSPHSKRWQDIQQLLEHGIDVYTTLNVQHIESLNDIVTQIIGVRVHETVPDSIVELADTIELVDLPPDDLIKRLQEGKVYFPAQAEIAALHFFRKANLTALREIALRYTADRVDVQVLLHRQGAAMEKIWPTTERLLVCVSPEPTSTKLIRTTRRMAERLRAEWLAVYISPPKYRLSRKGRHSALQNLRLAEQLGAETIVITGNDVAKEILRFAHQRNVTKIVVGKHIRPQWQIFFTGHLVDKIVRNSGDIDVYIITTTLKRTSPFKLLDYRPSIAWPIYWLTTMAIGCVTLLNFLLFPYLSSSNLIMFYLLVVVIVALRGHRGPAIWASILSVVVYDFFFIPPRFTFAVSDTQYLITLAVMLIIGQMISQLPSETHRSIETVVRQETRTEILYGLTQKLARTRGIDQLLNLAVDYLAEVFDSRILTLLPAAEDDRLLVRAGDRSEFTLNSKEQSIAQWVFDNDQIAGLETPTLPVADALYIPMRGTQGNVVGVLKIKPKNPKQLLLIEQLHLLESCAHHMALAIEAEKTAVSISTPSHL